jgi:DNA-binding GntR family transcriptional regulator
MSFLPVSEALLRLEVEGLLESRPRAGTRVRIPTPQDVEGHFVVREALETQAARLFALTATAEEHAELFKIAIELDDMAGVQENDRSQYLTRHERLHRKIAEYARCQALADAIEQTHALASTWMCVGNGGHLPRRHQMLVEALTGGEPEAAAAAMREHIRSSQQDALRRLSPYFKLQKTRGVRYTRSAKQQAHLIVDR